MTSTTGLTPISNVTEKYFIDSNVLVYAYNRAEPRKRTVATELIASLLENRNAAVSVQVLGEFFRVVTRRIATPLSVEQATAVIDVIGSLQVLDIDMAMVRRAIATHSRYGVNYWDSLIIAAAERANCTGILSEDFNSGQSYHGILAVNPFAA